MKKINLFFVALIFLILLIPLVSASDLSIGLNYNPYPAIQGQQLTLEFTVINSAEENLTDLEFELGVPREFDLVSRKTIPIDSLLSGESITLTYLVEVDEDAEGKEEVELFYKYKENGNEKNDKEEFTIKISEINVFLAIANTKTTPENLIPGQPAILEITLENEAESDIKDIIISLDLTNLPFAPEDGVTEKKISKIKESDSDKVLFNILTLSKTSPAIYKIPITLTYYDSYGQKYQKTNIISLNVWAEPELEISLDKNELIQGNKGKISINILNKGLTDIIFMEVNLKGSDDFEVLSSNYVYVGKIESDDYESVEFEILTLKENINLNLEINYKDTNNKKYAKTIILPAKVYSKKEAIKIGLIKIVIWPYFVLLIVIAIVLWIIIAKIRKKRRKKNAKRLS